MKYTLIFIDTETTGGGPEDRLIQVAYKTSENTEVNEYFSTEKEISIGAMAVHHITPEMLEGKPLFKGSATEQDLKERFAKGEIFIAHNAPFDVSMIEREGLTVGPVIDTLKIARHLDTEARIESYALQYLRYLLGIRVDALAHDAWGDILVLEKLFYRMLNKMMEESSLTQDQAIEAMIEISEKPQLYRKFNFGKYKGKHIKDIAESDPGYLKWLLNQKEQNAEEHDVDWIYTLRHYLHID
jgi:DNA polymerase III epsilon subunit-like protein